jgi:hypothetical protein
MQHRQCLQLRTTKRLMHLRKSNEILHVLPCSFPCSFRFFFCSGSLCEVSLFFFCTPAVVAILKSPGLIYVVSSFDSSVSFCSGYVGMAICVLFHLLKYLECFLVFVGKRVKRTFRLNFPYRKLFDLADRVILDT